MFHNNTNKRTPVSAWRVGWRGEEGWGGGGTDELKVKPTFFLHMEFKNTVPSSPLLPPTHHATNKGLMIIGITSHQEFVVRE